MFTRIGAAAFRKDLTNTIALCEAINNPQNHFKTIHIAGTNGKGSSAHMLASVLQSEGYKTGLYTSPHLRKFEERIKINGVQISEEEVIEFTHRMEEIILQINPSFFELCVAMAFNHFLSHSVDIAVIETGMGGRLDSTNIILPEICLITTIGLDHTDFLGPDLPSIAKEKAGIIKRNVPIVISQWQEETAKVFEQKANEMHAPLFFADQLWQCELLQRDTIKQEFKVQRGDQAPFNLTLDLLGSYQIKNLPGVLETLYQLQKIKFPWREKSLFKGLSSVKETTGLLGRWHWISQQPRIVCDTGHNEDGIKEVVSMLKMENFDRLHMIIGVVSDKDSNTMLSLLPKSATYYFTKADIPRALDQDTLKELAKLHELHGASYPSVKEALDAAIHLALENDLIFVGGSTFVVAEVV